MERISNFEEFENILATNQLFVLYTTTPNCGVCHADLPKVEALLENFDRMGFQVDVSEIPMLTGQLNLFSSPTVIIFLEGREYHRQVRIIDFDELSHRLEQINEHYF